MLQTMHGRHMLDCNYICNFIKTVCTYMKIIVLCIFRSIFACLISLPSSYIASIKTEEKKFYEFFISKNNSGNHINLLILFRFCLAMELL